MRRVLTSTVLLAFAAGVVTASTVTASTAADPGSAVPSAPAAGPPPASEASEPVRYRSGAPASSYVPRTASGKRVVGDAHEVRWTITRGGSSGAWTWQRIGSPTAVAADGLLTDPALAAPTNAVWFWRAVLRIPRGHGGCIRLFDASIQRVVDNSRMCLELPENSPATEQTWIYDSPPVVLNPGQHLYILQGLRTHRPDSDSTAGWPEVGRAELVARWVEQAGTPTR